MTEDTNDFPTAPQLYKYFNDYAEHFGLWPFIRLGTKVVEVTRADEKWTLRTSKDGHDAQPTKTFDRIAFATGSFIQSKAPKLEGDDLFAGPMSHSVEFHDPAKYKDQTVLIIGLHASAQDTVAALSGHARKVYCAHRSGVTIVPRYTADGSVIDKMPSLQLVMIGFYVSYWFPAFWYWLLVSCLTCITVRALDLLADTMQDTMLGKLSKGSFPNQPDSWGLTPAPSSAVTQPLISSTIFENFQSGFCEPTRGVQRFTGPRSVELTDRRSLDNIDAVIYCTGYHTILPTKLPDGLDPYPVPGEPSTWYRNIFPIHADASICNSLALMGHNALKIPGFAQWEVQASCISQIWQGKSSLPSFGDMRDWRRKTDTARLTTAKKYTASGTFYPVVDNSPDYPAWLDSTAGLGLRAHFGFVERWTNWCAWKLWWNDRELWQLCLNGFASPAIYVLFETGKRKAWSGARERIFADNAAVKRQQERRLESLKKDGKDA